MYVASRPTPSPAAPIVAQPVPRAYRQGRPNRRWNVDGMLSEQYLWATPHEYERSLRFYRVGKMAYV